MSAFQSVWGKVVIGILVCLGVGILGSVGTKAGVSTWYPTLSKPSFTPPSWLFAPVWTFLYILMGIAVGLVWQRSGGLNTALILFLVQLVLNAAWSFLFFTLRSPLVALLDLVLLWGVLLATLVLFFRTNPLSGWLLLPYLAWTSFALVLNATICWLNR